MINDGNTVLNPPSIFTSSPTNNVLSTNIQQNPSDFTHRRSSSHIQPSSETFNCQEILSIYPGECIPIPLVYSYQSFEFMIRPKQEGIDSEWSDPISIDSIPEMTSESRLYTVLKNNNITKEREKMNLKVDTQTRTHGKCKRIQSICLKKNEEKQSWYCYLKRKFTSPKVDNTESIHTSHAAYIYKHTMDIVLTPAYIIHNNLPLPLNYAFYGPFEVLKTRGVLKSEESEQVYIGDNATDVMYLRINIEGYRWSHDEPLHDPNNPNGHIVQNIKLEKCPFAPNTMSSIIPPFVCCMKYDIEDIYIYSHYMLTNYTSMPLKYRWGTSESLLPPINPIPAEIESDGIDYYNNFHYYKIAPDDINNIYNNNIYSYSTPPYLSYNNNSQLTLSSNANNMMTLTNDASPYPSQRSLLSNIKDNDIYITPPLSSSNIISPLYLQSSIISINDDNNNNNNIYSSNSNLSNSNPSTSNLSNSNLSNSNLSNNNLSTNTMIPLNTIKNSSSRCPSFASVCNPHESDQFIPQNIDIPIEKSVLRRRQSKKQMFKTVPINNSTYSFNFEEKAISLLHFFENRRDPLDYRDSSIFPHGSMIYIRVTLPTNIKESLYLHIEKNSTFEELLEYVSKSLYNNPKYLSIYDYKWLDVGHEKREITMGISILNYLYSLITITKEDIKENLKENHSWMHLALRHKIHDNIRFYKHYESTYPCVTFSDPSSISICNPQNEQYTDLSYWITNEMEEKHYSNISLLTQLYYYNLSKPLSVISSSSTLQTPIISSPASTSSFDALDPSIFEIPLKNSQNQIINKVMEPVTFQYNLVLSQKQSDIDNICDKYLSLYPQYYLHNTTNVQLLINFTDSDYYCYLPPKSCGPLHWISQSNSRELCITILQNTSNSSELSYSSNNIVPFNGNGNNNNNIYSNLSLKTNLWSFSYPFKIEETKKYSIRIPRQNKKEGTDAILTCDVMYTSSSSYILSFSFHHACISCVLRNYCYFPIQYAQIPPKEENRRIRNEYELLPANSYQDYIYKYNNDTDVSLMVLFPWESNKHCHQFNLEDENKSYTFKIDVKLPVTENILRTNIFRIYKNGIWVKRELVLCPEFLYIHKSNRKAGGRSMLQGIPLAEAEIILKSQIWNKQKKTEDDYDLQMKLDYISVESFSRGIEYPTLIQLRDICSKYDNPDELICTLFERRLIRTQKSSDWRSKMIELSSSIRLPSLVTFELKPSQVETTYIIIIKQDNRQFIFSSSDHDIMLKWAKDLRRESTSKRRDRETEQWTVTVNVIKEGNDTIIEFRSGENQPRTYFGRKQRNKTVQDTELSIGIGYIGLSLIDKTPEELLYVYFYNILGNYIYSKQQHNYSLSIDSLQIDVQTPTPLFPSMVYINRKSIQSISEGKNDSEMYRMINRKCECSGCGIEFKQNVPFYYISTPSIFLSKSTHRNPLQQLLLNTYTERYIVIVLH
ncbi:hypothetical protein WA158_001661 [Blastocystis sp. Blastoise]